MHLESVPETLNSHFIKNNFHQFLREWVGGAPPDVILEAEFSKDANSLISLILLLLLFLKHLFCLVVYGRN